jgi:pyruvate,water dikinase
MDLRDENGPITLEWPFGLVRRALLEVGRRMQQRGLAQAAAHALELAPDEVAQALDTTSPGADEFAGRQLWRSTVNIEDPRASLATPSQCQPSTFSRKHLPSLRGTCRWSSPRPASKEIRRPPA